MNNPLAQLSKLGQSPWYDQMTRSLVSQGTLKKMIEEDGLRGLDLEPNDLREGNLRRQGL